MMLKNSEETITAIAAKVGYDNPGKFAATFRFGYWSETQQSIERRRYDEE